MAKQLLIESYILDASNKEEVQKRNDLYESLGNGKILYENKEISCLGIYRVPISKPGIINRNKRIYTENTWKEPLSKGEGENSLGLVGHPSVGSSPNLKDSFAIWRDLKLESDNKGKPIVKGDLYLLNNDNGSLILSILEGLGRIELSSRGYGEIRENGEVYNYNLKSIDAVYEGSASVNFGKDEQKKSPNDPLVQENIELPTSDLRKLTNEELLNLIEDTKKLRDSLIKRSTSDRIKQITEKSYKEILNNYLKETERRGISKNSDIKTSVNPLKLDETFTNNKIDIGENNMNTVVIQRLVDESYSKKNKFKAFNELKDLGESIKDKEEYKEVYEDITKKTIELKPLLEQEYQGDANDKGSAVDKGLGPKKKIKDTDEPEPDDVDSIEVNATTDTSDSERTGKTGIKAASSPDAIVKEVQSGEISGIKQGMKANESIEVIEGKVAAIKTYLKMAPKIFGLKGTGKMIKAGWKKPQVVQRLMRARGTKVARALAADVNDYGDILNLLNETSKVDFQTILFSLTEEELNYLNLAVNLVEDTDEDEPDDVKKVEVDGVDDTSDRSAHTDKVAGGNGDVEKKEPKKDDEEIEKIEDIDLSKLNKDELVDVVDYLNEATKLIQDDLTHEKKLFDTLSDQYLKLETYTMQAEKVVEMDKTNKEKAQDEVTETVDYIENAKKEYDELIERVSDQQKYIGKLEDEVLNKKNMNESKKDVKPYVSNLLRDNPQLMPFERDINKAKDIFEAREMAERFNSMKGNVRLDKVLTEDEVIEEKKGFSNEGSAYLKTKNWI